jgi:integrase
MKEVLMAWVEKLPSGRYRGGWRDPNGRKHYISDSGRGYERMKDAKEAAQEEEVKARRRAAKESQRLSPSITWGEWWDLIGEEKTTDGPTDTARVVRNIVRAQLRPKWGDVPLNEITYQRVKKWATIGELKVRKGMSPEYVHRIFGIFSWSFQQALDEGVLDASPCAGVKLPKRPKKARPYIAVSDSPKIGEHLRGDYRDAVDFDLETGLRPGEICGLHADRLDLDTGWMTVAEVFVTRARVIRAYPKDDDMREVPLSAKAIEIIRRRLAGRDLNAGCGVPHADGATCTSALVFLTDRARPMSPKTLSEHIKNASHKAGLPRKTAYAGRRGWATRVAQGGLDPYDMADVLGHEDLKQLKKSYVQKTPAARGRVLAALGERPQLTVVEGDGARGADRGAGPEFQPVQDRAIEVREDSG